MNATHLGGLDAAIVRRTLLDAADLAATRTLPHFRTQLVVDNKWSEGFDPVTAADRDAEQAIRELLEARFPEHGIIGEEWDDKPANGPFEWVIDPIDGTRAFISGVPVWGTLLGLLVAGRPVAGLMAQPFTGEVYLAMPGEAHYHRGGELQPLQTSTVTELAAAKLTTTSPDLFRRSGQMACWERLWPRVLQTRYGLDCYGYCLLAAGHLDLVVEAGLKAVDIAPLIPIIETAGGVITTWAGEPATAGGDVVAAATPQLHAAAQALLQAA